ncbi:MAG: TonB-dependent receptor [candidate division WOR-3 bacterium]
MRLSVLTLYLLSLAEGAVFTGQVLDSRTNQPVPFAEITVQPLGRTIFADSLGRFALEEESLPGELTLFLSRVGYQTKAFYNIRPDRFVSLWLEPVAHELEPVSCTGSRIGLQSPAPRSLPLSVIRNTETRGRTDISGLLAEVPSATLQEYGNLTTVSLRGASPEQTLVMLDGVPLNSSMNGLSDITLLPVSPDTRIEVVRGGSSAIHGANSVGGVVNLVSPQDVHEYRLVAQSGLGSFGQTQVRAQYQEPSANTALFLASSFLHANNDFPYRDSLDSIRRRRNADVTRWNLTGKVMSPAGQCHRLSFLGDLCLSRKGAPGPLNWPTDSARQNDVRALGLFEYCWNQTDAASLTAKLNHQWQWQNFYNPAGYFPANDTHQTNSTSLDISENWEYLERLVLAAGLQPSYERARSTAIGKPSRLTVAGWAEARWEIGRLGFNPALRYDISSQAGPTTSTRQTFSVLSPRLALTWAPLPELDLSVGVNRSYRQPTFNELFWPASQWSRGNPNLKPERSTGFDLAIGGGPGSSWWRAGGFYCHLTDLIHWQPGPGDTWRPVNVDTATTSGAEAELNLDWRRFGFTGSATYMVCRSHGLDLPYRPRLSGRIAGWVGNERARLTLTAHGSAQRFTDATMTDTLPGFILFDAELSSRLWPEFVQILFRAGCRNLLDRHYQLIKDYPVPSRTFYAELELGLEKLRQ